LSDSVAISVAVITALGSVGAAAIGLIGIMIGRKNERHLAETKEAINILEKNTNSIKDALIKVTGESEFAKGKLEGQQDSTIIIHTPGQVTDTKLP
jgi:hypothetical protein